MSIPKTALPIIDWADDFDGCTDTLHKNVIPLCPHCKEWSYYTASEADKRGGFTICPFCQGEMYMPSSLDGPSPYDCNVECAGGIDVMRGEQSEAGIKALRLFDCDSCDRKRPCKIESRQ